MADIRFSALTAAVAGALGATTTILPVSIDVTTTPLSRSITIGVLRDWLSTNFTSITSPSALALAATGANEITLTTDSVVRARVTAAGILQTTNGIYGRSDDTNSYFECAGSDIVRLVTGGVVRLSAIATGVITTQGSMSIGTALAAPTDGVSLSLGVGRAGNGDAIINLVGDTTYSSYGFRIYRESSGAPNAATVLQHRGTNQLGLYAVDSAPICFWNNGTNTGRFTDTGFFKAYNNGTPYSLGSSFHELTSSSTSLPSTVVCNSSATPDGLLIAFSGAAPNSTARYAMRFADTVGDKATLWSNGDWLTARGIYGRLDDTNTYFQCAGSDVLSMYTNGVERVNLSTTQLTLSVALKLNNAAVAETPTATHTLTMVDSAGATYRVLCVA